MMAKDWWYDIKKFPEQRQGVLIAGIEYGVGKDQQDSEISQWDEKNLKADDCYCASTGKFRYRTRIIRWFEILGADFKHGQDGPQGFERRIQSTNWLMRARKHSGETNENDLRAGASNFAKAVKAVDPEVLVLMGIRLFDLLMGEGEGPDQTRKAFEEKFGKFLGSPKKEDWAQHFIFSQPDGARKMKRFRFGHTSFEGLKVIAFPHPSGSRGLSDAHISHGELKAVFRQILGIA